MKSKENTLKTVKDLKKYLEDFNDSDYLHDICIKQVKPTRFGCNINCNITLNENDCEDACELIKQKLRSAFGQKIEVDSDDISCEKQLTDS